MKCYYHEDREAVGTCQTCGKSLCRECASLYTPLTCEDCHREIVARSINEREKARQDNIFDAKVNLIKTLGIGCIFGIALIAFNVYSKETDVKQYILAFVLGMGFPFGWNATKAIPIFISNGHMENFFTALIFNCLKVVIAFLVGIPVGAYKIFIAIRDYISAKK